MVLFSRIPTATRYTDLLDASLIPFLQEKFPDDHCHQQDNDPKHCSYWVQDYFATKNQLHQLAPNLLPPTQSPTYAASVLISA